MARLADGEKWRKEKSKTSLGEGRRYRSLRTGIGVASIALAVMIGVGRCRRRPVELTNEALLASAWAHFRLGEFTESALQFRQVSRQAPPSDPLALNAIYGLAMVADVGSDINAGLASDLFHQIVHDAPTSEVSGWARLALVRAAQRTLGTDSPRDREQLGSDYRAVMRDFPLHPAADEAFVQWQSLRLLSLDPNDARGVVADITAYLARGTTHFASTLYDLRAGAHRLCRDYRSALDDAMAAIDAREIDPVHPSSVDAGKLYSIGVAAQFDVGDFATARRFYQRLLIDYPTEPRAFTVEVMLRDMDRLEAQGDGPREAGGTAP